MFEDTFKVLLLRRYLFKKTIDMDINLHIEQYNIYMLILYYG